MGFGKDSIKAGGAALWIGIITIVVVLALLAIGTFGFGWFSQKSANFRGETAKRNLVEANGPYRVQAYDHFFDLCTSVQGFENIVAALKFEKDNDNPSAKRLEQINGAITINTAQRRTTINQYNNDGAKGYTQGNFLASNLPYPLDANAEETQCAVR